ncbi:MAG TPA: type II toxin-antitoxin system PemK/MazF family toxin [Verrucomicrobiales bacterium]|nr:type II toxin-antitoxin system PemK/MazF family toxin [Verrucomicrobiales bacterium]
MGKPVIGEVVVVPFPQKNLKDGKRRPALVVADLIGDDLILCQITSQARTDSFSIPLMSSDFQRGRLAMDSFIRPNRLFTVEQSVILYTAAKITDSKLQEIKTHLRRLFT